MANIQYQGAAPQASVINGNFDSINGQLSLASNQLITAINQLISLASQISASVNKASFSSGDLGTPILQGISLVNDAPRVKGGIVKSKETQEPQEETKNRSWGGQILYGKKERSNDKGSQDKLGKNLGSAADAGMSITNNVVDSHKKQLDKQLANEKKAIDKLTAEKKKGLDKQFKNNKISEKEYKRELEKLELEANAKKEQLDKDNFEKKKKADLAQAAINMALSIGKSFAMMGWPAGIFAAAMAAATGAVQIAMIAKQTYNEKGGLIPISKAANGLAMGILNGASHANGGMKIMVDGVPIAEVEGGEALAVINKNSTSKYLPLLSRINSMDGWGNQFARGGVVNGWGVPSPATIPNPFRDQISSTASGFSGLRSEMSNFKQEALNFMDQRINSLKVLVVESDITLAQQNVKKIQVQSTF